MIDPRSGAWRVRLKCAFLAAVDIVWSRQIDSRGKAAGGRQKIWGVIYK